MRNLRLTEIDTNALVLLLARAFLLTLATAIFISAQGTDIVHAVHEGLSKLHANPKVWARDLIVILLVVALMLQWFCGVTRRIGAWFVQHHPAAAALVMATFLIIYTASSYRFPAWQYHLGFSIFFLCCVWYRWPNKENSVQIADKLHRYYFVDRIADIFSNSDASLRRIAILGTWGSGKTTILKLLEDKLAITTKSQFRLAFVNPWKAQTVEEAWAILANGFDRALGFTTRVPKFWASHKILFWMKSLIPLPGVGDDLIKFFEDEEGVSGKERIERINRILVCTNAKIVLLVDDMERASPTVVRNMFPVIDRLCELNNCYFVFAIDRDRIARAFESASAVDEARGYLDKVFDLQITLPAAATKDVAGMLKSMINQVSTPKLSASFSALEPLLSTNPRSALRFLKDAQTKEVLFLVRYRDKEHAYTPFFILRMLESEFPGTSRLLKNAS